MSKRLFKEHISRGLAGVLAFAIIFTNMNMTAFAAEIPDAETDTPIITEAETPDAETDTPIVTEAEAPDDIVLPETENEPAAEEKQPSEENTLQSRMDALPTVEEFLAMADGTSVDGSTLNQAQLDVYNEAQAIAEEMDGLTDEEQGLLDVSRLEALFEYWNHQVEENADYSFDAQNGFTVDSDKSLTANFTVTSNSNDMRGWLLCLMESKPSVGSGNKLSDSDDAHPYSYSNCKYYFFASSTQKTGNITVTWKGDAVDEKGSQKSLADAISEKDWYIVIGPRHYNTKWGDNGIGAGTNGIWENCDYYVGRASAVIPDALHKHNWQYSVDGNSITAKCTGEGECTYKGDILTCTLNVKNVPYTGKAYSGASIVNNITSATGAAASICYVGRDGTNYTESTTAPVDAGTYTAKATIGGATVTVDFSITKADTEFTVSLADWVYGKTASTPDITGNDAKRAVTYFYKERGADDSTYAEVTDFAAIPLGTYTLKASMEESANYNASEATCDFAVTKVLITVNVSMDGWTYGDAAKTPGITDGSNPGSGKVTYTYYTDAACANKTTSADGAARDGVVPENAGTYYVKADVTETETYAAGSGIAAFTIAPKEIGIEWSGDSFTYNGKTQAPTAAATGLVNGDACTITVTGGQTDTNVKAGNDGYTATAAAVDNTNYALPANGTAHQFTIAPAELTVTWTDMGLTYNGRKQSPAAELKGVQAGDTCTVTVTGGQTDTNAKTGTNSYQATAVIADANYTLKNATCTFTIAQKSIKDAVVKLAPGDMLHTGAEVTQSVDSVTVDGVTLSASDYEVAGSSTLTATDFGVYTITLKGIGNYTGSVSVKWKLRDGDMPTGEITIAESKWTSFLNNVTFGRFFKETQKVTIHAQDAGSGVDKVYYYNSNEVLTEDAVGALADETWTEIANGGSYNIDPEDKYVVYAKIADKSGNETYISSDGFVIDKTAPKITGVENSGTYCEAATFTATDANLDAVTVDGREVVLNADGSYTITADNETHTIVANDKAGNVTTVQVTVYEEHDWKEPVFIWSADYTGANAVFICANNAGHVETKDCTVKKVITKQATGTQKGEITYTATVIFHGVTYQSAKTQETVIAGSEEIGLNGGKITTEIIVSDDMPRTEIKNLTVETAKSLLTAEELAQVEAGAEITIYLEANSLAETAVSTADKNSVESKLDDITDRLMQSEGLTSKRQVTTGVQYMDLSLYKKIGNGTATKLKSIGQNELEITIDIPDNLKSDNSNRIYYVIRVHETDAGVEVAILPTTRSGDTLTFKTDRFSTYAIAYAEPNGFVVPTEVTLNPAQATLTSVGSTMQLTATVAPENTTNKNVTWKSSDTSVATVDANGLVTAVANGTATITATTEEGGLTATATITVDISSGNIGNGSDSDNPGSTSAATQGEQQATQSVVSPKTGDDFNMALWTTILLVAAAGLLVLFGRRQKKS